LPVRFSILLIALLPAACVEPFEPQDQSFESVLVVEGQITDRQQVYTIRLSQTAQLSSGDPLPESGASVSVTDQEGSVYCFEESFPGTYRSDSTEFTGRVGSQYQLTFVRTDGSQYQSDPITLKQSPPIDSVYYEVEQRLTEVTGEIKDGISIFVDAHDSLQQTRFYRYEYTETYEIKLRYPGDWVFSEQLGAYTLRKPSIGLCYATQPGTNILIANTSGYTEDRVRKLEVAYVATDGYKLSGLYSILVRQYALDEQAYSYWRQLQKTSETLGTLFDPQPYQIRGNIHRVDDNDEAVLGYFSAGAVSEKMLFVDHVELQAKDVRFPYDRCIAELDSLSETQGLDLFTQWGYLIAAIDPIIMISPECGDCRFQGTQEKPDFWPR